MFSIFRFFGLRARSDSGSRSRGARMTVEQLEDRSLFNTAPILGVIPDQTMSAGQGTLLVPYSASDADGDAVTVVATARKAPSLLNQLDAEHQLTFTGTYNFNLRGAREKYLRGDDGLYFLRPNGNLYLFSNTIAQSELVASVGKAVYARPKQLWQPARPGPAPVTVLVTDENIVVQPAAGYVGTFVVGVRASDGQEATTAKFSVTVTPPQVASDKSDYTPDETAILTATGFRPGESVQFEVQHVEATSTVGAGHSPWNVADGSEDDLDGKVDGNVQTSWHVNPDDSLGATFLLTALGLSSGLRATSTFTDGPNDLNIGQHQGEGKVNGVTTTYASGNVTEYAEGDSINFRFAVSTDLTTNATGTVQVRYTADNFFVSSFGLGTYDASAPAAEQAGSAWSVSTVGGVVFDSGSDEWVRTLQISYVGTTVTANQSAFIHYFLTLEDDLSSANGSSQHSRLDNATGDVSSTGAKNVPVPGNQIILLPDIDVTKRIDRDGNGSFESTASAGEYRFNLYKSDGDNNLELGTQDVFVTSGTTNASGQVNFINVDDGTYFITETQLNFSQGTYTFVSGSVSSGSPSGFDGAVAELTVESGTSGNVQNASVTFNNAVGPGSITVIKDAQPNDGQDFSFTTTGTGLSSFSLDDDNDGTLSNTQLFSNLQPGTYTITETSVGGWTLSDIDGADSVNGNTATVVLAAGEDATVTFTNVSQAASITVIKDAQPSDGQDFSFTTTGTGLSSFSLDDDNDGTLSNTQVFSNLTPGTYTITETSVGGWTLSDIDGADSVNGNTATVVLAFGEHVTVTFTNVSQAASITVIKDAQPNNAQDFSFTTTGTGLSSFTLDDDSNPTLSNTQVFSNLEPGTYTITETSVGGWTLSDINGADSVNGSTATVVLERGEHATVTFVNSLDAVPTGSITVVKNAQPNSGQDFSFTTSGSGLSSFTLDDDSDPTLSNSRFFGNLQPGTYTITESAVSGWTLSNITGADSTNGNTATVVLTAGENATVTFVNTANLGSITVVKNALPNDAQDFQFTTTGTGLSSFTLDDDDDPTLSNSQVFSNLQPGTYTIAETAVGGWTLTNINGADSVNGNTATVVLALGEHATVTFTNTVNTGSITVIKDAQPDDAQDFSFTTTGAGLSSFTLDDDADGTLSNTQVFSNLLPGTYTITETAVGGWTLSNITGADSVNGNTATVVLSPGEEATVTFVNAVNFGSITVIKDAQPEDGQDFPFTTTGTGLSSFTLDDDADPTLSNTQVFSNLLPGTYTITETAVGGWTLSSITGADSTNGNTATVILAAGENVTVTFVNDIIRGSITVIKDSQPENGQDFSFTTTGTGLSTFTLDDDADGTLSNTQVFSNLLPGTYTITETATNGWTLSSITGADSVNGSTATVIVSPGENATVTFVNQQLASISGFVYLDTNMNGVRDGGDEGIADVTVTLLDANGQTVGTEQTNADGSYTFADLLPGTYTVVESQPSGLFDWHDNIGTIDGVPVGTNSVSDTLGGIELAPGNIAINYNFGELFLLLPPEPGPFSKRSFII